MFFIDKRIIGPSATTFNHYEVMKYLTYGCFFLQDQKIKIIKLILKYSPEWI